MFFFLFLIFQQYPHNGVLCNIFLLKLVLISNYDLGIRLSFIFIHLENCHRKAYFNNSDKYEDGIAPYIAK